MLTLPERRSALLGFLLNDESIEVAGPLWGNAVTHDSERNIIKALYEARFDFLEVMRKVIHDNELLEKARSRIPPR